MRQDLAAQLGQPDFEVSKRSDPKIDKYLSKLSGILSHSTEETYENQSATSASACRQMLEEFAKYYIPFRDKVMAPARAAQEATDRAEAPVREALADFKKALGKDNESNPPSRNTASRLDFARALLSKRGGLRNSVSKNGELFCEMVTYTDTEGLNFLLTEVWPDSQKT